MPLFNELSRRNVVRVGIAYAVIGWIVAQVAEFAFENFGAPDWVLKTVVVLLLLGLPLALFFAWAFEMTPEGVKKEKDVDRAVSITPHTGRKIDWTDNGQRTIAVLPFINLSDDSEQEYFSDGLSEELLNLLAQIPELRVTSRTSAFSFKGKDATIAEIGRTLGVEHVLEGSVRRSGDTIRITAQLIEVSTDTHVWSDSWDRDFQDVFVIQDEIAEFVVGALKIQLLGEAPRTDTTSPEAYTLYLQSKALADQYTATGFLQAEAIVRRLLAIDSTYVPAWVLLARIYAQGSGTAAWQPHEAFPKSRAAVMEALRLDPDSAQAHAALSAIASDYDYDMEAARKEQEIALTLAPHDLEVLVLAAELARIEGDFSEAIRLNKELEILDPVSWGPKMGLGRSYFRMGRLAEAKSAYAEVLELLPTGNAINFRLGSVMLVSGDLDDALSQMNKANRDGFRLAGRALVLHAMGDTGSANTELEKLIAIGDGDRWAYETAQVQAYFGNLDESFRWLDRAIKRRDQSLRLMTGDPFLNNLRDDPRFDDVLERLGHKVH